MDYTDLCNMATSCEETEKHAIDVIYALPREDMRLHYGWWFLRKHETSHYWALTSSTGEELTRITELQRSDLWPCLRDPVTGELWRTLRPFTMPDGLYVEWNDMYTDSVTKHCTHNACTYYPSSNLFFDFISALQECIQFAVVHHGCIVLIERKRKEHRICYVNQIDEGYFTEHMVRVNGIPYAFEFSDKKKPWERRKDPQKILAEWLDGGYCKGDNDEKATVASALLSEMRK